jgi:hypothetical protein
MQTSIADANQRTDYFRAQIGELPFSDFKSFAIHLANVRRAYACHGKDKGRRSLDAFLDSLHLKDCKGATDAETFRALDDAYLSLSSQFDWHAGALNIYGADNSIVKSGQGRILDWLTGAVGIRHLDVFTITCGEVLTTLKDRAGTSESVRPVKGIGDASMKDAIRLSVAIEKFQVSRATLRRAIAKGDLKSYRSENVPAPVPHLVSEAELERLYPRRNRS